MNAKKNGKAKAENGAKKAEPKGLSKPGTKVVTAAFPGSYARFTGDFGEKTAIRSTSPKLVAIGTYGKLKALIVKSLADGKSLEEIGKSVGVSGSRISEFCVIFSIDRPKTEGKPKTKKEKAAFAEKMKAARASKKASKPKAVDQGEEGDV